MPLKTQLTRRSFLQAGGFAICCCCAGPIAFADSLRDVGGCSLIGSQFGLLDPAKISQSEQAQSDNDPFKSPVHSTGDREKDLAYDRALKRLSDAFGVRPSFAFYDDRDFQNAWASPRKLAPETQGTVVFGKRLFDTLMSVDPSGVSVLQVSAHEFGHITQYVSGTYDILRAGQPNSKHVELHADFLSGFYLGLLKIAHANASLWWAGQKIFEFGDFAFKDPTHHGTPQERVEAAEAGFRLSYFEKKDFAAANQAGIEYAVKT